MSVEENKRSVMKFFQHLNSASLDEAFEMLAPDATWWVPTDQPGGMVFSKDGMRAAIGAFYGVFAQLPVFKIGRTTAEGDRVCVEHTSRNGRTHRGATYANDYHMVIAFRDGLIVEIREYMNPILAGAAMAEMSAVKA